MNNNLIDYRDRESWLRARASGIGASEVAALFGCGRWDTITTLWMKKTGQLEEDEGAPSRLLKWGQRLEPAIAAGYQEDSGRKLWKASPFAISQHPNVECMQATTDFFVLEAPDRTGDGLVEVKNVAMWMARKWEPGVPDYVQFQAQHQMSCTGRDFVTVLPLFGGNDDRPIDIERNQGVIDEIEEQCQWFWGFVMRGEPPPVDGSERTLEAIKKLHPLDDGTEVALTEEAIGWWAALENAKLEIKAGEANKTDAETRLKAAIGSATYGRLPDGRRLTLFTTPRSGYQPNYVEPTTYRTLKLEKTETKGRRRR